MEGTIWIVQYDFTDVGPPGQQTQRQNRIQQYFTFRPFLPVIN